MSNAIRLNHVTKRFGSQLALDDVSLEVAPGTVFALLGENGAGKSTLMNVLYGLYQADEGEILLDDIEQHFAGPGDAMAAGIGATFVSFVIQFVMIEKHRPGELPRGTTAYRLVPWTLIALPLVIMDSSLLIQTHADLLVLNAFVTPDQLGIYYAAAKTISLIGLINFAVTAVANQKFAALNAAGNHDELGRFIRQTTKWTFWPAVAAAAGLLILGKPLLWLFSPEFTVGYTVMMILAVGHIAKAYSGQAEMCLSMIGHQKQAAIILIGTMVMNVAINITLIPIWGVNGAAIATVISLILQSILLSAALKRLSGHQALLWVPGMGKAR